MTALHRLTTAAHRSADRRRRQRRLRTELAAYRTPAERAELDALLAAHDTSVKELIESV